MGKALIIFVRFPQLGKVKTRLAAQIGNENALLIYKNLLEHTRSIAEGADCDKYVFATEPLKNDTWKNFYLEQQIEGDLGERMSYAFDHLFNKNYRKVVIIGSDCPGLTTNHLDEAYSALDHHDVVIGPANDGGYYLLGMKKFQPAIFKNKKWSTASVFEDTIETFRNFELSYMQLQTLTDVDDKKGIPENWEKDILPHHTY